MDSLSESFTEARKVVNVIICGVPKYVDASGVHIITQKIEAMLKLLCQVMCSSGDPSWVYSITMVNLYQTSPHYITQSIIGSGCRNGCLSIR